MKPREMEISRTGDSMAPFRLKSARGTVWLLTMDAAKQLRDMLTDNIKAEEEGR